MNESEIIRRVWHTSRSIANRLDITTAGELKGLLAKVPPECDAMPVKQLLSLSAACSQIFTLTDQVAGYPPSQAPIDFDLCIGNKEVFWEFYSEEDCDRVWRDLTSSHGWQPDWALREGQRRIVINSMLMPTTYRWKTTFLK